MANWADDYRATTPVGQSRRLVCPCAPHRSASLVVSHREDGGLSTYCFRCAEHRFDPGPKVSAGERILRAKAAREREDGVKRQALIDPGHRNPDAWPAHAVAWIARAGLRVAAVAEQHGFGYREDMDRVVMPVYWGSRMVYWQARGFSEDRAKYINPRVDRSDIVYTARPLYADDDRHVILTEDILSAIKVASCEPGAGVWSLMGTTMTDHILARIVRTGVRVTLWLDPDDAGRKAMTKLAYRLSVFGVSCRVITSDVDPKLLPRAEIMGLLTSRENPWRLT